MKSQQILTPPWSKQVAGRTLLPIAERGLDSPALFAGALPQERGAHPMSPPILQIQLSLCDRRRVAERVCPSSKLWGVRILFGERLPTRGLWGGWGGSWRRVSRWVVLRSKQKWGLSFPQRLWQTCQHRAQRDRESLLPPEPTQSWWDFCVCFSFDACWRLISITTTHFFW